MKAMMLHALCDIRSNPEPLGIEEIPQPVPAEGEILVKEEGDKEELLELNYTEHLWMEKEIKSVANVCRADVIEFPDLAAEIPIRPVVQEFPLSEANRALWELKTGNIRGAKVLHIG